MTEKIALQTLGHDESDRWHCYSDGRRFEIFEGYTRIIAIGPPEAVESERNVYELHVKERGPRGVKYAMKALRPTCPDEFMDELKKWHYDASGKLLEMFVGFKDVVAIDTSGTDSPKRNALRVGKVKRNPKYMEENLLYLQILPLPQEDHLAS